MGKVPGKDLGFSAAARVPHLCLSSPPKSCRRQIEAKRPTNHLLNLLPVCDVSHTHFHPKHCHTSQIHHTELVANSLPNPPSMSSQARIRSAIINRDTNETKIQLALNLDGGAIPELDSINDSSLEHAAQESKSQTISVDTGIGFLDHMLHALAKHGGWSMRLRTRGDLHIDDHHTAEDTFIALGQV